MSTSDDLLQRVGMAVAQFYYADEALPPPTSSEVEQIIASVKREYETPTVEDVVALCTKSIADIETQRRQGGFDSKWLDGAVYAFNTTIHRITDRKRWAEKHARVGRESAAASPT